MKKRVLSVLICMVLVLGSLVWLTPDTSVEAASAVKLNKKKMTMYVGDTFTLKLKNATGDVKFSSTDKKVAKVSSKGVVTAVAEGKATIKAKYNKKTYKCKITVKEDNRYIADRIQDPVNPLPEGCGIYEIKLGGKAKDHDHDRYHQQRKQYCPKQISLLFHCFNPELYPCSFCDEYTFLRYFRKNTLHIIEKPSVCQSFRRYPSEKGRLFTAKNACFLQKVDRRVFYLYNG